MGNRILVLLAQLGINALALILVDAIFARIWFEPQHAALIIATAVLLALVNTYLRPIVVMLTLPLNIITLGLFTLIINAAILQLVAWLIPAFHVDGFWTAVGGALVISVVSFLLNWFLNPARIHVRIDRR